MIYTPHQVSLSPQGGAPRSFGDVPDEWTDPRVAKIAAFARREQSASGVTGGAAGGSSGDSFADRYSGGESETNSNGARPAPGGIGLLVLGSLVVWGLTRR